MRAFVERGTHMLHAVPWEADVAQVARCRLDQIKEEMQQNCAQGANTHYVPPGQHTLGTKRRAGVKQATGTRGREQRPGIGQEGILPGSSAGGLNPARHQLSVEHHHTRIHELAAFDTRLCDFMPTRETRQRQKIFLRACWVVVAHPPNSANKCNQCPSGCPG